MRSAPHEQHTDAGEAERAVSPTPTIRAIETEYAGCRFRSRLEARWAVFLDALDIRWQYEPQGFETSAGRYLPDFLLTDDGLYVEVKGSDEQLDRDMHRIDAFASESRCSVVILGPVPRISAANEFPAFTTIGDRRLIGGVPRFLYLRDGRWSFLGELSIFSHPKVDPILIAGMQPHPDVLAALDLARSARFEHGRSG